MSIIGSVQACVEGDAVAGVVNTLALLKLFNAELTNRLTGAGDVDQRLDRSVLPQVVAAHCRFERPTQLLLIRRTKCAASGCL